MHLCRDCAEQQQTPLLDMVSKGTCSQCGDQECLVFPVNNYTVKSRFIPWMEDLLHGEFDANLSLRVED
jgi:hypothetical protein